MISLVTIAILSAAAIPCLAGPPYDVDDPGTAEYRHYEVNTSYTSTQVEGCESAGLGIEANYGYSKNIQLTLGIGGSTLRETGSPRTCGLDDSHAEFKWRFQEETAHKLPISVHYIVTIPTSNSPHGMGSGRVDHTCLFATGKTFGKAALFANVGGNVPGDSDEQSNLVYSSLLTYQATDKLNLGAEVVGGTPGAKDDPADLTFGVGMTYEFKPDRSLMLAVSHSTRGMADVNVYAGVQVMGTVLG